MQLRTLPARLKVSKPRLEATALAGATIRQKSRAQWIATRANYLRENPLCQHCKLDGRVSLAEEVDHIQPLWNGGQEFDENNLQGLCWSCHKSKSNKEAGDRANHFKNGE